MSSPAALHSAEHAEHYTPSAIALVAHAVMGSIDLDPFSCRRANNVIGASMFYSVEDEGFEAPWGEPGDPQNVFCNPPGAKVKRKPALADKARVKPGQAHAWWKLLDEYNAGHVRQAFFLSFNMNLFQTAQRFGYRPPQCFPFVVPERRLKFWGEGRAEGEGSPSHASAVIYLPPHAHAEDEEPWPTYALAKFHSVCSELGRVVVPA